MQSLTGRRVLITGGTGFIGTSLARRMADDNQILLFDNNTHGVELAADLREHDNVRLVEGDVLDVEALTEAAQGANVIVHLAAIAGVDAVLKSPVRTMRVNLLGTANVVEAGARNLETMERLLDFSTSEVFGPHAYKVTEENRPNVGAVREARWTYAISKLAGEYYSHAYHEELGLPTSIVRPFNIYGPGQMGVGAIHHFIVRGLRGEPITIHGDGSQIRAWCYIDDIVDAVLAILAEPDAVGHAFNIGNPRSVCTTYDLALRIRALTGGQSEFRYQPLHYSDVEVRIPDVSKARRMLPWEPAVDLDEGLALTADWYRERLAIAAP